MNLSDAVIKYRQSEERQEQIEDIYLDIDNREYEIQERKKQLNKELKNEIDLRRKESLSARLSALKDEEITLENQYELLKSEFKSLGKLQKDLEKIFDKKELYQLYDKFYGR